MIYFGARLAVFDIAKLRKVTAYDELELDTLADRKPALFLIMSDTDDSFNFLISMCYTHLFNLLCEKADDVYGGRLPVHVRCLIDECANIGQIPKLKSWWPRSEAVRFQPVWCCRRRVSSRQSIRITQIPLSAMRVTAGLRMRSPSGKVAVHCCYWTSAWYR